MNRRTGALLASSIALAACASAPPPAPANVPPSASTTAPPADPAPPAAPPRGEAQRPVHDRDAAGDAIRRATDVGDPAVRALGEACAARVATACTKLGDARLDGDPAFAAAAYERACDAGDPAGCFGLGFVLASDAPGAPHDPPRARALFARACDAGATNACSMLGLAYYWAHDVELDRPRAAALFEKACAAGEATVACFNLGLMHAAGDLAGGEAAARPLFDRACTAGLGVACHDAALLSDRGRGAVTKETADLFAKACSLGYAPSCDAAKDAAAGLRATVSSGRRSPVPTVAEWEAAPAARVTGAEAVGCSARSVREWLRVSCRGKPARLGAPTSIEITSGGRTDTYRFAKGGVTSIVTPFVAGARVEAELGWQRGHRTLYLSWPAGSAAPAVAGSIASLRDEIR